MGEPVYSKEGAGMFLGLVSMAMASGADLDTAIERVQQLYSGKEGMQLKMKSQFEHAEMLDLIRRSMASG